MDTVLAWSLARARRQTLELAAGISNAEARLQTAPGEHHPEWISGHLVLADSYLLYLLEAEALPPDFASLLERYGPASRPGSENPPAAMFAALVDRLRDLGGRRDRVIAALGPGDLERPTPDPVLASVQPTMAHHLYALNCHESYHAGQLATWRQARGRDPVPWAFAPPPG